MMTSNENRAVMARRRKFMVRIAALCFTTVFSAASGFMLHAFAAEQYPSASTEQGRVIHEEAKVFSKLCVEPGDTIWSIADQYRGAMSVQQYINEIMELNHLQSAAIYVGQVLLLP